MSSGQSSSESQIPSSAWRDFVGGLWQSQVNVKLNISILRYSKNPILALVYCS